MAVKKGGEIIAETLVKEGIDHVFGICGHGNVGLLDCLYDRRDEIRLVSPRHEQIAVHMADGFFRVSHKPAATLTSTGPGSCNQIMALAVAQTDSSAIYSITANVPTQQFNRGPFQELNMHHHADFNSVIKPVVKRSFQPTRVEMLPLAMRQAAATMTTGRPGPVNLDIPYNLFQEEAEVQDEPRGNAFGQRRSGASAEDVTAVADWLLAAERPVIFIGHGMALSEASKELTALAHRLGIPVISSPNGMGCLDMEDPLSLGFIGRNGAYQANQAGRHADLVLAIGARFDDRSASSWKPGYSWNFPQTKLVHVDLDHSELGRNFIPDLAILADARAFLRQVLAEMDRRGETSPRYAGWLDDIAGWRKEWEAFVAPSFDLHTTPIRPERIVADCQKVLPEDAILSLELGRPPQLVHAVLEGAPAAVDAEHLGIFRNGLRPVLDPRREARGARQGLRVGLRGRRLHDGAPGAVHRRRVRHSRGLGGVEQLCVGRDPRPSVRLFRWPRIWHRILCGREPRALQPRFRGMGARVGRRGLHGQEKRGLRRGLGGGYRLQQARADRRPRRRRRASARDRNMGIAAAHAEGTRLRQALAAVKERQMTDRKSVIRKFAEEPWQQYPGHFGSALSKPLAAPQTTGARHLDYRVSTYQPMAYVERHVHKVQEQVYHILKGEGLMEINDATHVVREGDVIFLAPGDWHSIVNTGLGDLTFIVVTSPVSDE